MKIKGKLMSFIIFIVIVPLAVMGLTSYFKAADVLNDNLVESNKALNKEITTGIKKEFDGYLYGVEAIAKNIDAVGILETPAYEPFLRGLFKLYVDNYPNSYQMYMGTNDGGMRIEPHFDFDSSYDPRARGWYKLADETKKSGFTDIYEDAVTGNIAISVSVPVFNMENTFIGAVATSIDLSEVSKMISEVKVGERGYVFILDYHGDVVAHPNSDLIGTNLAVAEIQEAIKSNPQNGLIDYQFANSEGDLSDKYVVFDYMPDTRWYIMTSMYYDEVASSTSALLYNALIIAIITIIVALAIAFVFSNSIVKPIRAIVEDMSLVEGGDMRVQSEVKSKDEIGELAEKFNSMVLNVRNLIESAINVSQNVENASDVLASSSVRASESSAEVTRTIEEIAQGSTDQAHETESAARLTGSLDDNFEKLYANSKEIAENADNVKIINEQGLEVLMDLKGKSDQNSKSTDTISDAISDLDLKSKDIGGIISTITSISEQTNLLALNASIEAARAGEHGRGFAVVADEIRKLAEESSKSADEISAIIEMIQAKTFETVEIMGEFKTNSRAQYEAVDKMDASFEDISNSIDGIVDQISDIDKFIKIMLSEKNEIVNAITNISSVSEETAAASEEVSATMDQQNEAVEEVAKSADKLSELSRDLSEQINRFKI